MLLSCFVVVLSGIMYPALRSRLISLFMGDQLVFDWDRLENFLITRDRPVGNKVTNTKCQVEYHNCKHSVPSP